MIDGCARLVEALTANKIEWQTDLHERAMLLGIVGLLQPRTTIELGVHKGGFTRHLAELSEQLYCVDVEKRFDTLPDKAQFYNLTTDNFFLHFDWSSIPQGRADLIIVDAGHSEAETYSDLMNSIDHAKVILMHDAFNPPCRMGYGRAIFDSDHKVLYSDLDLCPGIFIHDDRWGGIGLVIPK
jgi:hypothetical protein